MLSGTGLCDGPIPRPEGSCRMWRVEFDLETSTMMSLRPTRAVKPRKKEKVSFGVLFTFESCPFSLM